MSEPVAREAVPEAIDLRSLLARLRGTRDRIPVPVALEIAACIGDALVAVPADLAPTMVVVASSGSVHVHTTLDGATPSELPLESIDYLAPERLTLEPRSPASTVYSVAATLFEMVACEPLGAARGKVETHRAWLEDRLRSIASMDLRMLLRDCLAFEPTARPDLAHFAARARSIMRGGEAVAAWATRHLGGDPSDDVVGEAPPSPWFDESALDVPMTRLPEPSPHDPTYYLPDPTRPRPVEVPDFTDPQIESAAEDPPSQNTALSQSPVRFPIDDDVTELPPRPRTFARFAVAGAAVAAVAVLVYVLQPRTDAEASATPPVDPRPIEDQDTPMPAGVAAAVFESAAPDTDRIVVHCTGANARGATMAGVPVADAAKCTVTAILADRDRVSTVVTAPAAGRYRCFVEGSTDCQPQ
jgi:hypothetical protein